MSAWNIESASIDPMPHLLGRASWYPGLKHRGCGLRCFMVWAEQCKPLRCLANFLIYEPREGCNTFTLKSTPFSFVWFCWKRAGISGDMYTMQSMLSGGLALVLSGKTEPTLSCCRPCSDVRKLLHGAVVHCLELIILMHYIASSPRQSILAARLETLWRWLEMFCGGARAT